MAQNFEIVCPPLPSPTSRVYALRDGWRCEGEFETIKLGGELHHIAGLVQGAPFPAPSSGPLAVGWPSIPGTTGSLHAYPLMDNEKPVWQMDARIDLTRSAVTWPADFARRYSSAKYPLGLFAVATVHIGGHVREVLLPVHRASDNTAGSPLNLALWSKAKLSGVWLTIRPLDAAGRTQPSLEGWSERNVAPAGLADRRGLWVTLPALPAGFYELEIAMESASVNEAPLYYFYSPGPTQKP
jgi:hypothetical protein